ncbi:hypothetical protein ElyMa_002295800 [Elysia marginata]|uniref:Uncharacterized protein n=1 Tax=Elysia marginata TaxID=1093978 RepID=A0AAV4G2K5_9GAST|nr:hypothetical protein ElyMa_002295800 [Elysia marginata]
MRNFFRLFEDYSFPFECDYTNVNSLKHLQCTSHNIELLAPGPAHQLGHFFDNVLQRNELQLNTLDSDTQVEDICISHRYVITVRTSSQKSCARKTLIIKKDIKYTNLEKN